MIIVPDILQQEWQDKDGKTTRHVSFTVTLNQRMGPKHSQITEMQVLVPGIEIPELPGRHFLPLQHK